ncbi:hypothetical protein [Sneathiella glossodoripedis]|uniref:hypothetical protein n=1 Tax=Sneathiella glossodoripedis TaxID=418853 RepID=UPI000470F3E7|nr:hypothetical protein [Sneathiella glossodoripedis]
MPRMVASGFLLFALFVVSTLVAPNYADAARKSPSSTSCSFGSSLYDSDNRSGAGLTNSIGCMLYTHTNDNAKNDIPELNPFGIDDWVLADKSDGGGNGVIDLTVTLSDSEEYLGSWSVDSFGGYTNVFLTIKSGNGFAAFLLDTTETSGEWTTAALFPTKRGGGKDLSHMSLFYSNSSLTAVPLPAAFPLYAAGVAILGFLGWRRKKS